MKCSQYEALVELFMSVHVKHPNDNAVNCALAHLEQIAKSGDIEEEEVWQRDPHLENGHGTRRKILLEGFLTFTNSKDSR